MPRKQYVKLIRQESSQPIAFCLYGHFESATLKLIDSIKFCLGPRKRFVQHKLAEPLKLYLSKDNTDEELKNLIMHKMEGASDEDQVDSREVRSRGKKYPYHMKPVHARSH